MGFRSSKIPLLLVLAAVALSAGFAQASDDAIDVHPDSEVIHFDLISPQQAYARTQAVLKHFGVSDEPDSQPRLSSFQNLQTLKGLEELLPVFDPKNEFQKFIEIASGQMSAFRDPDSRQVPDFSVALRNEGEPLPPSPLLTHLRAARSNPPSQPLLGLKIALDPGHMGGSAWDQITGKWVEDSHGRKLSEGVINLQTAMLLADQLKALGAQVMLTRSGLRPVTTESYASLDLHRAGLEELRESTLQDWFLKLLAVAPEGPTLDQAFEDSNDFQALFSEQNHWLYFNRDDLQARVDEIRAFQPDITLILHYDADTHEVGAGTPFSQDGTKVYVAGSYDPTELASREDRVQFAREVLDQRSWQASLALAHEVVNTLSTRLNVPFDPASPGDVVPLEPGVYARNLYLLKKYQSSATVYVESLFYNDPGEFAAFSDATYPMQIDGVNRPYSDRLLSVATSLREAVVNFVRNFPGVPQED